MTATADIWELIEPYLAAEHLVLDDIELTGIGKGRVLRVAVDGEKLDVDRLADLSRGISRLLDNEASIDGSYQLEVSTPGLERKLRRPEHFQKSVGREVVAKVALEGASKTVRGVIADAGAATFTVEGDNGPEEFSYDTVVKAKTVFRWERSPKPGH